MRSDAHMKSFCLLRVQEKKVGIQEAIKVFSERPNDFKD